MRSWQKMGTQRRGGGSREEDEKSRTLDRRAGHGGNTQSAAGLHKLAAEEAGRSKRQAVGAEREENARLIHHRAPVPPKFDAPTVSQCLPMPIAEPS